LINTGYHQGNFTAHSNILNFVASEFGKCLTASWRHSFLARNESRIYSTTVSPEEYTRLHVPQIFLDQYMALTKEWIPLAPAELIFNLDECGFSDWEEWKPQPVLIPSRVRNIALHYPIDRGIRHQTLLCCITAAGDAYSPLLVSADGSVMQVLTQEYGMGSISKSRLLARPTSCKVFSLDLSTKL
jgi:hypothetical protein